MLYIESIDIDGAFTGSQRVICLYYNSLNRMRYTIGLTIRDTTTNGVSRWTNAPRIRELRSNNNSVEAQLAFEATLEKQAPYGYVPDMVSGSGHMDSMLVAIDKPSLEFLKYVDEVVPFDGPALDSLSYHLRKLEHDFVFWDSQRSIVNVNPHGDHNLGFTLFQGLCFAKLDWYKNRLFLRASPDDGNPWYEVKFTDVTKARGMLSKAALRGYNPIFDNLEMLNKV